MTSTSTCDRRMRQCFYPYLSSGPVPPYQMDVYIFNLMGTWCTLFLIFILFLIEFYVRKQHSAGSDLGLHSLPGSHKRDARLECM